MPSRKLLGAAAMAGALTIGGAAGAILGNPISSGAKTGSTPTTTAPLAPPTGQPGGPGGQPGPGGPGGDHGPGRGFGGPELDAAAKAIGITTQELQTQLRSGKTIADVAKAKGVDRQKVVDAMVAAADDNVSDEDVKVIERSACPRC